MYIEFVTVIHVMVMEINVSWSVICFFSGSSFLLGAREEPCATCVSILLFYFVSYVSHSTIFSTVEKTDVDISKATASWLSQLAKAITLKTTSKVKASILWPQAKA